MADPDTTHLEREALVGAGPVGPKRRRGLKIFLIGGGVVLVAVAGLAIAAPTIASALAPGIITSAAAGAIAGKVSVGSVSLSWMGPQKLNGFQLADPAGMAVGKLDASASVGLLRLLTGAHDLGTITLAGDLDLERNAAGETNLQRAVAPSASKSARATAKPPSSTPAKLPPGYTAKVDITNVNVAYRERDAEGQARNEAAITGLKGIVAANTGNAAGGAAMIDADLQAAVKQGPNTGGLKIKVKLDNLADANGVLQPAAARVNADIQADKLPVALLDAVANQRGLLLAALGETLGLSVVAETQGTAGSVVLKADSPNLAADMELALADGRLTAKRPGTFAVRSTQFAQSVPAVRDALLNAGLTLTQWPSIDGALASLDVPVPTAGQSSADLDFRKASIQIEVKTTALAGTLATPATAGQPAAAPRAIALAPATLRIASADLSQKVELAASTQATLDGQNAGGLRLTASAEGLTDANGKLAALAGGSPIPGKVDAALNVDKVSAAVLQPFITAAGLPIEIAQDLGPSINLQAIVATSAADRPGATPPVNATITLDSGKLTGTLPLRYATDQLTTTGESVFTFKDAGRLARKFLNKPGQPPAIILDGPGDATIRLASLSVPMPANKPDLAAAAADLRVVIDRLSVALPDSPAAPVELRTVNTLITLRPKQPLNIKTDADLAHAGRAFTASADLALAGLIDAFANKTATLVPGAGPVRAVGTIAINNAPMSLAALRPGVPAGADNMADVLQGVVGNVANIELRLGKPTQAAIDPTRQSFEIALRSTGIAANVAADLSPTELRLLPSTAQATLTPDTARGLLKAFGQDQGDLAQIQMAAPAVATLTIKSVTIPVKVAANAVTPDFARAGNAQVALAIRDTLLVRNVPFGERRLAGGLRGFQASATMPLGMLAPNADTASNLLAELAGELILDERTSVAKLAGNVKAAADQSAIDASLSLTAVNTAALDSVLDQPGMTSGALGADASLTAKAIRTGGQTNPIQTTLAITSPRLKATGLNISMAQDRVALQGPARVEWTVDPAFADRYLLAKKDEQGRPLPATMRLLAPAQVGLDIRRLAIAIPKEENGQKLVGPLKPGVFALEAQARIARVELQTIDPQKPGQTAPPTVLQNVVAAINSDSAGTINLDATIGSLASGNAVANKPLVLKADLRNIADQAGVLFDQPADRAVVNLNASGDKISTAVLDSLAQMNGQLVKMLGTELDLTLKAVNASRKSGQIDLDIRSRDAAAPGDIARIKLAGPISDGALRISQATPLVAALSRFKYDLNTDVLKMFPLFASVEKLSTAQAPPGDTGLGPSMVTSSDLVIPIDGDMRKFNGDINVDLGVIEYKFADIFGEFLDNTILNSGGVDQLPIKPFIVQVRKGVASYDKFDIPVRNFKLQTKGSVDLVAKQVDVVTYIPTVAASKGLLGAVNGRLGAGLGKLLPEDLSEATMIPIRARGPLDKPSVGPDFELFLQEFGDSLLKQPDKLIEGVLDLLKPRRK